MKVSLSCITGNEEAHIERFLESFGPAFDELCLVRAVGSAKPDGTLKLARRWCAANRKAYREAEYTNGAGRGDWPHVDDFAAARNLSRSLVTGQLWFWADIDDVLSDALQFRAEMEVLLKRAKLCVAKYEIPATRESVLRERAFREDAGGHWRWCLHENYIVPDAGEAAAMTAGVLHAPLHSKERDPMRNRRILAASLDRSTHNAFDLHREHDLAFRANHSEEDRQASHYWARIALAGDLNAELRLQALCNLAQTTVDPMAAKQLAWDAIRLYPNRREGLCTLAELELAHGMPTRAVALSEMASVHPQPKAGFIPQRAQYYAWEGFDLMVRAYRGAGQEDKAAGLEAEMWGEHGPAISVVHATRRPQEALFARQRWLSFASDPARVEWVFGVDADDETAKRALYCHRMATVEPGSCVRAWNAAAQLTHGKILVQMSDDWQPCPGWDAEIVRRLDPRKPEVLAVSDGHRKDGLLCMAILTRARYEQQGGTMFAPDYLSVYSDDEFAWRARKDGVIVQARDLIFRHVHPVFTGAPMDAVYQASNAPERYANGLRTFLARNPDAASVEPYRTLSAQVPA